MSSTGAAGELRSLALAGLVEDSTFAPTGTRLPVFWVDALRGDVFWPVPGPWPVFAAPPGCRDPFCAAVRPEPCLGLFRLPCPPALPPFWAGSDLGESAWPSLFPSCPDPFAAGTPEVYGSPVNAPRPIRRRARIQTRSEPLRRT